jgi:putative ABC transport system permease protein
MRITDYIEQSLANLRRKKLRTFLTTFGVVIGIGALVCMIAFGEGVQKNLTDTFEKLGLFNYIYVYPRSANNRMMDFMGGGRGGRSGNRSQRTPDASARLLNDQAVSDLSKLEFVQWVLPEERFSAAVRFNDNEETCMVQVLPADICRAGFMELTAGDFYKSDQDNSVIISEALLRRLNVPRSQDMIGKDIELSTVSIVPDAMTSADSNNLPFTRKSYTLKIAGVSGRVESPGQMPIRSDICIPKGTSERIERLPVSNLVSLLEMTGTGDGYSMVTVKLSSPRYVESVSEKIEQAGFSTFAMADQLERMNTVFIFIDMFIFAIGMIAIVVASLGIINTMIMSILERYKEIGIIKAVGASNRDVKGIFFFESGVIGFLGGVFGLALGWFASLVINQIINFFAIRQGAQRMAYFNFPWWLCLGAIGFAILVSVIAGIYPTIRASQVDPVVALRHD